MKQPQKNAAALFAILAGLVSIPLTWMTVYGAQLTGGPGNLKTIPIDKLYVTGVNGSITFLFPTPIWIIIGIAIVSNLLQLVHYSRQLVLLRLVEWLTALFGVVWIGLGICVALFSDKTTLGVGSLLGFFCAGVALLCVAVPTSTQQDEFSLLKGA